MFMNKWGRSRIYKQPTSCHRASDLASASIVVSSKHFVLLPKFRRAY